MAHIKLFAATISAVALLAVAPDQASAQARGRAVPRPGPGPVVVAPAPVHGGPYRGGGYYPAYPYRYGYPYPYYGAYPHASFGFYFGFPYGYAGFGWGVPYAAPYPYAYPYPFPYGAYPYPYRPYGGVRIALPQRNAQVYIDGYYGGIVDQYDGTFQQVNLEPGAHHIEVRAPGFETTSFDVNVGPGQTITYKTDLKPAP